MNAMKWMMAGAALLLLAACSGEALEGDVLPQKEVVWTVAQKNQALRRYALALAKAVQTPSVRREIRSESVRKWDGDFEVLVSRLEEKVIPESGCHFREHLMRLNAETHSGLRAKSGDGDTLLSRITHGIPNVQVAVPVHCQDWDVDRFVPWVAVLPCDYVEKPGNRIVAYDADGREHLLSADVEPDFPVLVVGCSERVNAAGTLDTAAKVEVMPAAPAYRLALAGLTAPEYPSNLCLTHGFAQALMLEWTDVCDETAYEVWRMSSGAFAKVAELGANDNNFVDVQLTPNTKYWYKVRAVRPGGYSSWSPIMATTASNRNDNEWLKIKRMRFSSSALKAVEGWISGAPEIRLRVIQGSQGGATNVFTSGMLEPSSRSAITDTWWNREVTIFAWSTNVYGTVLTFDWREEDWLDNVDFTLTGSYEDKSSGGTVKVGGCLEFKDDDGRDVIGNTSVMWWQERSQIYDLSGFQWQFVY
jgi:hypothetical protein